MNRLFGSKRIERGHLTVRQYVIDDKRGGWSVRESTVQDVRHMSQTLPDYPACHWRLKNKSLRKKP